MGMGCFGIGSEETGRVTVHACLEEREICMHFEPCSQLLLAVFTS